MCPTLAESQSLKKSVMALNTKDLHPTIQNAQSFSEMGAKPWQVHQADDLNVFQLIHLEQ